MPTESTLQARTATSCGSTLELEQTACGGITCDAEVKSSMTTTVSVHVSLSHKPGDTHCTDMCSKLHLS